MVGHKSIFAWLSKAWRSPELEQGPPAEAVYRRLRPVLERAVLDHCDELARRYVDEALQSNQDTWSPFVKRFIRAQVLSAFDATVLEGWKPHLGDSLDAWAGDVVLEVLATHIERLRMGQELQVPQPEPPINTPPSYVRERAARRLAEHRKAIAEGTAFKSVPRGSLASESSAFAYYARLMEETKPVEAMTGLEFETHCANLIRRVGWTTELTKASGDQGVDIVARHGNLVVAVQCKRYRGTVGNAAVQEVFAGGRYVKATHCIVVSTGRFTTSARELAASTHVDLLHHTELQESLARLAALG